MRLLCGRMPQSRVQLLPAWLRHLAAVNLIDVRTVTRLLATADSEGGCSAAGCRSHGCSSSLRGCGILPQ